MRNLRDGRYTVMNVQTGEQRTFRVKTKGLDAKFAPGRAVVSLLVGPDNSNDYEGFGFVTWERGKEFIRVWRKKLGHKRRSRFEYYAALMEAAGTALARASLRPQDDAVASFEVRVGQTTRQYHVAMGVPCRLCGQLLTRMESINRGIGPKCAEKEGAD